jgi:hypothetical protein
MLLAGDSEGERVGRTTLSVQYRIVQQPSTHGSWTGALRALHTLPSDRGCRVLLIATGAADDARKQRRIR